MRTNSKYQAGAYDDAFEIDYEFCFQPAILVPTFIPGPMTLSAPWPYKFAASVAFDCIPAS